jgi:hypothetical protein
VAGGESRRRCIMATGKGDDRDAIVAAIREGVGRIVGSIDHLTEAVRPGYGEYRRATERPPRDELKDALGEILDGGGGDEG